MRAYRSSLFCLAVLLAGLVATATVFAQTATTTTLGFSPSVVVYPGSTALTITVKASSGTAVPMGGVTLNAGSTVLLSLTLNSSGVAKATVPTTGYAAGVYGLTAKYAGNSSFSGSTSAVTNVTLQSPVNVAGQLIPNPITSGQEAEFEATLTATDGGGTPTGTVSFYTGTTLIGTQGVSNGSAVLKAPTNGIPTGTYPIVAKYNGDTLHAKGNSPSFNAVLQPAGGPACGTGSESKLSGQVAFSLQGYDGSGGIPYETAGSFTANGSGGVTGGEEDFNYFTSTAESNISNLSVYSVGSDSRGCLTLVTNQQTHTYRFALDPTNGANGVPIIEFDNTNGSGIVATGQMKLQSASDFSLSTLAPNYSIGVAGWDYNQSAYDRTAMIATFAVNTSGAISDMDIDINDGGNYSSLTQDTGTIGTIDANGRATMQLVTGDHTFNFVIYVISNSSFFIASTDTTSVGPVLAGKSHSVEGSNYTGSSLDGNYVYAVTGASSGMSDFGEVLGVGTITTSGSTTSFNSTSYAYLNGTPLTQPDTGTIAVAANGRAVFTSTDGQSTLVADFFGSPGSGSNSVANLLVADGEAGSGTVLSQSPETYSNSVLAGNYVIGDFLSTMPVPAIGAYSGETSFSSAGDISGTGDKSLISGLSGGGAIGVNGFSFGANGVSVTSTAVGIANTEIILYIDYTNPDSPIFIMSAD